MRKSLFRRLLFNAATAEPLTEQTATGNPASFTANVAKPLKGLTIPIESESGIAGLTIYRTGVNVWAEEWEKGRLDGSGGDVASDENIRTKGFIPVVPGQKYYVKYSLPGGGANGNMRVYYYDGSKTYVSNSWVNPSQITVPANAHYIRFYMDTRYGATYIDNISFNYPSTETDYNAYSGNSYTVDFGETVNAGSLEAVTGVLTVTSPESKTINLDPVQITTLVGANVVFTDNGGSNTVKYLVKA